MNMNDMFTVGIALRMARRKLTITVGVVDLIAKEICDEVARNDASGDFDPELFLTVAGVRT